MCYSKEVQLITSLIILISVFAYYVFYHKKYKKSNEGWTISFLNMVLLAALAIGFHQFFEFLSLVTNNIWIYKIGLIISISATYFLLVSLEVLSNVKIYSKIALIVIALIAVEIILSPMQFGSGLFYIKHYSAFIWWAAWLFLFFYWNLSALRIYLGLDDKSSKKTLLLYLFCVVDISFILTMAYAFIGQALFSFVNVCTDAPSIWCTFSVIQALIIPIFLSRLPTLFKRKNKQTVTPVKDVVFNLFMAFLILAFFVYLFSLFNCLSWSYIFPWISK